MYTYIYIYIYIYMYIYKWSNLYQKRLQSQQGDFAKEVCRVPTWLTPKPKKGFTVWIASPSNTASPPRFRTC